MPADTTTPNQEPRERGTVLVTVRVHREIRDMFNFVCAKTGRNGSEIIRAHIMETINQGCRELFQEQLRQEKEASHD